MDKETQQSAADSIVLAGCGVEVAEGVWNWLAYGDPVPSELSHDCRPLEFLQSRKTFKYMSKQDRLALSAAGKALTAAGLGRDALGERCGIYMTVGYLPFNEDDVEAICRNSTENDAFSMARFSRDGICTVSPLMTFACLPNMAAHHIAQNFGICGGYMIAYPDMDQFSNCLNAAVWALRERLVDLALVGAVADQNNFLVHNHYNKNGCERLGLVDGAAFCVLRRDGGGPRLDELEPIDLPAGVAFGPLNVPIAIAVAYSREER